MKKTFVILTIVLAILAAPVFADVTASGKVTYDFMYAPDYAEYMDSDDNKIDLDLGGTVGDYTSIGANLSAAYGTSDDTTTGLWDVTGDVTLDALTLTQDVTGALGVDSPVSVAYTIGKTDFGPVEYQGVAGKNDLEYTYDGVGGDTIMTKLSFGVQDMVTIDTYLYSGADLDIMGDDGIIGVNAYGTFGMVDASVSYIVVDPDTSVFGVNGAATVMEGLTVGAGLESEMADETTSYYGVSANYVTGPIEAGLGFQSMAYSGDTDLEFSDVSSIGVKATYSVNDMLDAYASVVDELTFETLEWEVGAVYTLDGVSYKAYVTQEMDVDDDAAVAIEISASF